MSGNIGSESAMRIILEAVGRRICLGADMIF